MLNIDDRLIKEVSPKIRPNALSVLLAIAIHLNQKSGRCFPSHGRIMELTGMGKNAVYDALAVLKDAGLLKSEQAIDSKNKKFGRRTFRLTTRFIKIFVDAEDAEPLTENREPENREPENREPENRETYQLNNEEQINNLEQINNEDEENAQNALIPPFTHVGTIQLPETNIPLEAEKKEKASPSSGPTPPPEFIITTVTPQEPYLRLVEKVEIEEKPGPKTPTTTPGRRSQAAPTIHPENLQAFDHFSDPEKCRALWSEWIEYKWGQHRDKYKTPQSELVMLRKLYTWSHGQAEIVSQIIEKSVGSLYKGLFDPNEKKGNGTEKRLDLNPAQRQHLILAQYVAQRRVDAENRNSVE